MDKINRIFRSKTVNAKPVKQQSKNDLTQRIEALLREKPRHIAYKESGAFYRWVAEAKDLKQALNTRDIIKYNDKLETLIVTTYMRVHVRNRTERVGDFKQTAQAIRGGFKEMKDLLDDAFNRVPSVSSLKMSTQKMQFNGIWDDISVTDELGFNSWLDVKGPLADTDLVVVPDEYKGMLPNNGVHLKEFKRLQKLYIALCGGKTKLKVGQELRQAFNEAMKLALTKETSRDLIDKLLAHKDISAINIGKAKPGEEYAIPQKGEVEVGWSGQDLKALGHNQQILEAPAYINLLHELIHVYYGANGENLRDETPNLGRDYHNLEEQVTITGLTGPLTDGSEYVRPINENVMRSEFGLLPRVNHDGMLKHHTQMEQISIFAQQGNTKKLKALPNSAFKELGKLDDDAHPILSAIISDRPDAFLELRKRLKVRNLPQSTAFKWLSTAVTERSVEVLDILLNIMKLDAKAKNDDGFTLLHIAAINAGRQTDGGGTFKGIVNLLVKAGVDLHAKTTYDDTALDLTEDEEAQEVLLKLGLKG